jgi:iron complex outermembrane recepter protein
MISGAAIAAVSVTGAQAQQASSAPAASTSVQELVVTGSRIPQKNLTSVSPVTTVNNQTVKLQGTTNVEDLINNLPQAFADFGQFESNGSTGTATIDLRGLGDKRTLVLIDGKRLMPGDPTLPVADINMIPPALIDRVEVLTGGASAVYGSDAVAGVVNFIMKHNYEGLQIDAEFSIGMHENDDQQVRTAATTGSTAVTGSPSNINFPNGTTWAGERYTATITGGANSPDGKGNVEFYLGYTDIQPVLEAKYDWSSCGLSTNSSNTHQQYCGGSVTAAGAGGGLLQVLSGPNTTPPPGAFFGLGYQITGPTAPCTGSTGTCLSSFTGANLYNFAPLNYIQRPDIRYQAGEFSHYEVAPWLDLYSSFMFMDDHTVAQIAGSGSFYGDNVYTIPCNDPLLSAAQANTLCGPEAGVAGDDASALIGRRDVEGTGRTSDITHEDYRIVFGAKGDLGSGWNYDLSMQYGRSVLTDVEGGYFLNNKLLNALDVVPNPATGGDTKLAVGAPVCESVLNGTDVNCVPYNLWTPGGVTQSQLNYLEGTAIFTGFTTEQVVTGTIAGDLGQYGMKSPWASDGIGLSLGLEYRREYLSFTPDSTAESGELAGFGGSLRATEGSQADKDVFGELRIPIVQDMPFFKELVFEGGFRYSDYTSGGGNWTYKAGMDWQVTPDIRLRGSYERAVRAPNVNELFAPETPGLIAGHDPCAGNLATVLAAAPGCANTFANTLGLAPNSAALTSAVAALAASGISVPQCISSQCGNLTGGNADLKPETAKTWSVGFVFTPTFFRGFSLSVDYFNINVADAIITLPLNGIFNDCINNGIECQYITRNAAEDYATYGGNGAGFVETPTVNAASLKTSGVDVNADYRVSLSTFHLPDYGSLDFNFTGTYVHDLTTALPGLTPYNCAGLYGVTCGTPTPKWRHQFRVTWATPWNLTVSLNWRFLSSTSLDFNTNQPALQDLNPNLSTAGSPVYYKDLFATDARIPDFSYFDLSFQYKFKNRYTVRGGVNNIFDRTPPLLDSNSFGISAPAFGNANTYPQVFDPLGRVLFVGLTADF